MLSAIAARSESMSNLNRVQAGIPEGGQFSEAAKSRPQALAELSASLAVAAADVDEMDFDDDMDGFSVREDIGLDRLSGADRNAAAQFLSDEDGFRQRRIRMKSAADAMANIDSRVRTVRISIDEPDIGLSNATVVHAFNDRGEDLGIDVGQKQRFNAEFAHAGFDAEEVHTSVGEYVRGPSPFHRADEGNQHTFLVTRTRELDDLPDQSAINRTEKVSADLCSRLEDPESAFAYQSTDAGENTYLVHSSTGGQVTTEFVDLDTTGDDADLTNQEVISQGQSIRDRLDTIRSTGVTATQRAEYQALTGRLSILREKMETDYSTILSPARTPNKDGYEAGDEIARGDGATFEISDIDSSGTITAVGNTIDSPAGPQTFKPHEVSLDRSWVQRSARQHSIKHFGVPQDEG